MTRTVAALYETRAQAEEARAALEAAHLGQHVDIKDRSGDSHDHPGGLRGWLDGLIGGHHDQHLYDEGLRRGHVLLAAKVDDLGETRAAEILDAATPVDLARAGRTWQGEGWTPPPPAPVVSAGGPLAEDGIAQGLDAPPDAATSPPPGSGVEARLIGAGVRAYSAIGIG